MRNLIVKLLATQLGGIFAMIVAHGLLHYGFMMDNWTWVHSGFIGTIVGCAFLIWLRGPQGLFGYIPSISVITVLVMMSDVSPWWMTVIGLFVIQGLVWLYFKWEAMRRTSDDDLDKYERQFHV